MRFLNYCRHKTVGWEGVLYEDERQEVRVSNGVFDWPLTPKRKDDLEIVERIDVQKVLSYMKSRSGSEALISLIVAREVLA